MRLAHQTSALQLCGQIAVRHRLVLQQAPCVIDQKSRGVKHDEHFGDQRLNHRLAGFARDRFRNLGFLRVQAGVETPALRQFAFAPPARPMRLRRPSAATGANLTLARALEFAQNFARRRIHRLTFRRGDLQISSHKEI